MHIGHRRGWRPFNQHQAAVVVSGETSRLQKQSTVNQRCGKVGKSLPLDQDFVVDQIIADRESCHPHVEIASLAKQLQQRRVALRVIRLHTVTLVRHHSRCARAPDPKRLGRRRCHRRWRHASAKMSTRGAVAVTAMGRYRQQRIGLLDLLGDLSSAVVVPRSVWKEPLAGGQPCQEWRTSTKQRWSS
jgi:hypothetical protein